MIGESVKAGKVMSKIDGCDDRRGAIFARTKTTAPPRLCRSADPLVRFACYAPNIPTAPSNRDRRHDSIRGHRTRRRHALAIEQ